MIKTLPETLLLLTRTCEIGQQCQKFWFMFSLGKLLIEFWLENFAQTSPLNSVKNGANQET